MHARPFERDAALTPLVPNGASGPEGRKLTFGWGLAAFGPAPLAGRLALRGLALRSLALRSLAFRSLALGCLALGLRTRSCAGFWASLTQRSDKRGKNVDANCDESRKNERRLGRSNRTPGEERTFLALDA